MGAKACMALALWQPDRIANLIAVDNAPVDAALKSDFHQYVQGMKEVERVGVKSQKEADALLVPFVKVGEAWSGSWWPTVCWICLHRDHLVLLSVAWQLSYRCNGMLSYADNISVI